MTVSDNALDRISDRNTKPKTEVFWHTALAHIACLISSWTDVLTATGLAVDLRGVGRMISRNERVSQLQILSELLKTEECRLVGSSHVSDLQQ